MLIPWPRPGNRGLRALVLAALFGLVAARPCGRRAGLVPGAVVFALGASEVTLAVDALVRLANRIHRRGQAQATRLVEWLAERGLSPHGHSHQPGDRLRRSDLEQLSRLDGAALDRAFVKVMTARDRAGTKLATTEARTGGVPAIRQLAQQLLAEEQARTATLQSWRRVRFKPHASRPPSTIGRHP